MKSVLFVCSGNICRSPMGEVLYRELALSRGETAEAASAGTYVRQGQPSTNYAIAAAKEIYSTADLTYHGSQPLTPWLMSCYDLILCAEQHHASNARRQMPDHPGIYTIHQFAYGDNHSGVDDPYGGSMKVYRDCAAEIHQALLAGWERLL